MSTMVDTQMLDFPNDQDIQMHPSSSDIWIRDEVEMEEDNHKHESDDGPVKIDVYTQGRTYPAIEVDMEPISDEPNYEYEMIEDEEKSYYGTELLDVEVYDDVDDTPLPLIHEKRFLDPSFQALTNEVLQSGSPVDLGTEGVENAAVELPDGTEGLDDVPGEEPFTASHVPEDSIFSSEHDKGEFLNLAMHNGPQYLLTKSFALEEASSIINDRPAESLSQIQSNEGEVNLFTDQQLVVGVTPPAADENECEQSKASLSQSKVVPQEISEDVYVDPNQPNDDIDASVFTKVDVLEISEADVHETSGAVLLDPNALKEKSGSSALLPTNDADPHEISEGVYIDPPPPVLLSLVLEDRFDFSFFNRPAEWTLLSSDDAEQHNFDFVLLKHLPTLYYEPLSAVFESLRQDALVQSMFNLPEAELVVDAVDLQLAISEDNVYARDITLHDLNVLHDVMGVNGLLRIRMYASIPRFITRYQQLQEQVSRTNLEQPQSGPIDGDGLNEVPYTIPPVGNDVDHEGSTDADDQTSEDNDNDRESQRELLKRSNSFQLSKGLHASAFPLNSGSFFEKDSNEETSEDSKRVVLDSDTQLYSQTLISTENSHLLATLRSEIAEGQNEDGDSEPQSISKLPLPDMLTRDAYPPINYVDDSAHDNDAEIPPHLNNHSDHHVINYAEAKPDADFEEDHEPDAIDLVTLNEDDENILSNSTKASNTIAFKRFEELESPELHKEDDVSPIDKEDDNAPSNSSYISSSGIKTKRSYDEFEDTDVHLEKETIEYHYAKRARNQ